MKAFENLLFQLATIMGGFGIYETIYGRWDHGPINFEEGQFDLIRLGITVFILVSLCTFYAICLADQSDSLSGNGEVIESKLFDPNNGLTKLSFLMAGAYIFVIATTYYLMGLRQAFCFGVSMTLLLAAEAVKFIVVGYRRGRREGTP